tara:strand:- start:1292 stop:1867 length:576 start_codon:yes stop_codon:yes gene_type:complete
MELYWTHIQQDNVLKCIINDSLHYICIEGGKIIQKVVDNQVVDIFTTDADDDSWESEKHWLGKEHIEITGKYSPKNFSTVEALEQWASDNAWTSAPPLFGMSAVGSYLDRLQRSEEQQLGADMTTVVRNTIHRVMIEQDSEGNYFRRLWSKETGDFFNVQPCCVFPHNPGREPLTKMQVDELTLSIGYNPR